MHSRDKDELVIGSICQPTDLDSISYNNKICYLNDVYDEGSLHILKIYNNF